MNKKILFFDIDGTLITKETYKMPNSTRRALRKAKENGHLVYINTGRVYSIVDPYIRDIGFDGYVCGCGTYIQSGDKVLLAKEIEEQECKRIIDILRECKIDAVLEGKDDVYFEKKDSLPIDFKRMKEHFEKRGFGIRKDWDSVSLQFDKFFAMANRESNIQGFYKGLEQKYEIIDRENDCFEVVPKGYSKGTGIEILLQYHNIPLENSFAFGDSSNDLPMLEYVANSIAMGDSDSSVYDAATFITKNVQDDGIEYALEHFGII